MYRVYQVINGDTIQNIADRFNMTADELISLNGLMGEVRPGELLVVPQGRDSVFEVYVVQSGDNVYEIARRYNVDFNDLLRLNGLDEDDYIYPNQELLVPKQGVSIYITEEEQTLKEVSDRLGITPYEIIDQNETIYLLPDQLIIYKKS